MSHVAINVLDPHWRRLKIKMTKKETDFSGEHEAQYLTFFCWDEEDLTRVDELADRLKEITQSIRKVREVKDES